MRQFSTSKKAAITMTYLSIIVHVLSTMIMTSFYLDKLGAEAYGLYQMIYSVAQYILILDLGISTVMVRYITEFDVKKQHEESENFSFHFLVILCGVMVLIGVIGAILYHSIEGIYPSLTEGEYRLAREMLGMMLVQVILTVLNHFYQGIALAYEQYTFVKCVSIGQFIVSAVLSVFLILLGMDVMGIVHANTVAIALNSLIIAIYVKSSLHFKIRFHYWNFRMLFPAFLLMVAMLLQSVVGYVNNSVSKTILGIMATKTDVAVYSIAATFITMFNALPTAISSVFQPKVTRMVVSGESTEKLTDFVIKPGRFQLIVVGGFCAGFFLFGRDFIICWTSREMVDAWVYVLLIMIPNAIPLLQNTCLAVLNAMDKRLYRSLILTGITVCNIILTIWLIRLMGPVGAPLATGISYIIGHCILMNIYYHKKIHLNIKKMFIETFRGIWLCILIALISGLPLMRWQQDANWMILFVKAILFCAVYVAMLMKFGLNQEERSMALSILKKVKGRIGCCR